MLPAELRQHQQQTSTSDMPLPFLATSQHALTSKETMLPTEVRQHQQQISTSDMPLPRGLPLPFLATSQHALTSKETMLPTEVRQHQQQISTSGTPLPRQLQLPLSATGQHVLPVSATRQRQLPMLKTGQSRWPSTTVDRLLPSMLPNKQHEGKNSSINQQSVIPGIMFSPATNPVLCHRNRSGIRRTLPATPALSEVNDFKLVTDEILNRLH
jgi:hypothetical protein